MLTFRMIDGKCVRSFKERREPVECPPRGVNDSHSVVERDECDKITCLRKLRQSKWVLDGCRCFQLINESTEACCCDQFPPNVKAFCRSDGSTLRVSSDVLPSSGA